MSHILIVGQKFSTLSNYLTEQGHTYTLLKDVKKTKFPNKKLKNRVVADFSSKALLFETIDSLKVRPDGVIVTYEDYVLPAAWISQYLGLPGMPPEAAEACTDKYIMRSLFAKAPEKISPAFDVVSNEADVRAFATAHNFPIILKPANLAKSLLVTKSNDLEELLANYEKSVNLLTSVYSKYAPNRQPKLIIEEFLEGTIHSVDAFVDAEGEPTILDQVVDYQTGYDIGFDDNFHYSRLLPSKLSEADQASLRHCAAVGVRALGMKSSPAHIEIIMTSQGPRIVEIGARNGGYRERMHALANGIDIAGASVATALGQPVDVTAKRNDPVAVLELFPKEPGIYAGIANEENLRNLPSLTYLSIKASRGDFKGKSADGHKTCAIIILHNSDAEQFKRDLAYVNQEVFIQTEDSLQTTK